MISSQERCHHRRIWPVPTETGWSRGKERLRQMKGSLCPVSKANTQLVPSLRKIEILDERQKYPTCAQFECNLASVLFACDEVFYNSVCDNTTPCFFMVSANSGDGAFPEPLILNNHIFIIFKIIFMKCCLSGVIYNTHISDCQP